MRLLIRILVSKARGTVNQRRIVIGLRGVLLTVGGIVLAVVFSGLTTIICPLAPGPSVSMRFDGFIVLPTRGMLNVLDYMALQDHDLFLAGTSLNRLFKIKIDSSERATGKTIAELPGVDGVHGVAIVPSRNIAFFTMGSDNSVGVLDPQTFTLVRRIPVADDPDAILYVERADLIYVANGDAKMATLIDPEKQATVGAIELGGKPEFPAIDAHDGLLYQNLKDINSVCAIDLIKRSVVDRWPLDSCQEPSGMAIDSVHRRLFSACSGNARLVVFDLEHHRVIAALDVTGRPDSVAFDPVLRRIYVAGVAGKLTVIEQLTSDKYKVLENIVTRFGAHTLALDLESHKVYVAYASLLTYPRIAIFSPIQMLTDE
jgi:DNA-binding beta-propeller fold protein YncE